MRRNNGKLFLYEAMYLLIVPAIFFVGYALIELLSLGQTRNLTSAYYSEKDKGAMTCLYIFYALVVLSFVYRTFTTRKLYKKVRVNPKRLFWYRIAIVTLACIVYVIIALLLGTARIAHYKRFAYSDYLKHDITFIFAMQGNRWWYILFSCSVGMTMAITYAVTVVIENLIFSRDRWFIKLIVAFVLFMGICVTHVLPIYAVTAPTLGESELFKVCLPVGSLTYHEYALYFATPETVGNPPMQSTILLCYVAWHISNIAVLASGIFLIIFCYLSISFLTRNENEDYLYGYKKEEERI